MPKFSQSSRQKLETCDVDLQRICNYAIQVFDFTVLYGHRTPEEQFELFKKGREFVDGEWEIANKKEVVTYCDGYIVKSNHNYDPSRAVDIVPYPINWKDHKRMHYLAGHIMMVAHELGVSIRWGGDWDQDTQVRDETFSDLLHFELL